MDTFFEGTVTLLFTDVEGSTELVSRKGDAAARQVMKRLEDVIRGEVNTHGGREIKTMGDGFMIAFPSARRAVACAVAIQEALQSPMTTGSDGWLRVRMGLNAGEAIHEGDDLFGSAVNAAARIAAQAKGEEILISEVVKTLSGSVPGVTFRDRGRFQLKGFDEPFRLYEVLWERRTALPAFERTPFVGRQEERAELVSRLDRAATGHGGLMLIGGEPGVGKTRLAEEIIAQARQRDMRALVGHCYESDAAPPYIAFVEIIEEASRQVAPETFRQALGPAAGEVAKLMPELRRMFPDVPPPLELPAEQERRYVMNCLREFVGRAAATRPLILVLDDLHWADESTLFAIEHIAQRLSEMAVLVLGTYRDTELDVSRPLARTIEGLMRQHLVTRIALRRLPTECIADMLGALSGQNPPAAVVEALYRETDGNPFFAEEVYRHLVEEGILFDERGRWRKDIDTSSLQVPESIRLVIGRRLERLGEVARQVLTAAAVIGRRFSFRLLQALNQFEPDQLLDAIDDAHRARLITPEGDSSDARFAFGHELIRQTLLGATTLPRLQRLHLKVAEAMEQLYATELQEQAADIAHHLLHAGGGADVEKTARYLVMAGHRAMEAAAFEEALRHYETALSLVPEDDIRGRAQFRFELGRALRSLGRFEEAIDNWRNAVADYEVLGDVDSVGAMCREIAVQLGWIGRGFEGAEWAARGLAALSDVKTGDRAELLAIAGASLSWMGQYDAGLQMIDEALEMAASLGDDRMRAAALGAKALHHYFHVELVETVDVGRECGALLMKEGALWDAVTFLPVVLFALNFLDRREDAEDLANEIEPLAERLGHVVGDILIKRSKAWRVLLSERHVDVVEPLVRRDLEMCRDADVAWLSQAYVWLGVVKFWQGEWDEARRHLKRAVETEVPGAFAGWAWGALFLFLAVAGERADALAMYEEKREELCDPGHHYTLGSIAITLDAVEALWVLGDYDEAARLYPVVQDAIATGVRFRFFDGRLFETLAGLAAAAGGQWPVAQEHFEAAFATVEERGFVVEAAEVRRLYGEALLVFGERGDRPRAERLINEAVERYEEAGMPRHAEMAAGLLAQRV